MHLKYLKYIIRHKWFVLVASWKIGAPLWPAIVHDLSKLLPSEWLPYCRFFYGTYQTAQELRWKANQMGIFPRTQEAVARDFDFAWMAHQRRNLHHWQSWVLKEDSGKVRPLPMPERYVLEMIADWMGAGRAITGKWDVVGWYNKNWHNMTLDFSTRSKVESIIKKLEHRPVF